MLVNYVSSMPNALASVRYRMDIPAKHMECETHRSERPILGADVYVFGKPLGDEVKYMALCKEYDKPVVWDVCDNHFRHDAAEDIRRKYQIMLEMADVLTCPTEGMREVIAGHGRLATVIQDPYEFEEVGPKGMVKDPTLMMYGNIASMNSMRRAVNTLAEAGYKNKLILIGDTRFPWDFQINQWSPEMMANSFEKSDLVVIPVEEEGRSNVKSPNRMVEAIRQGKFVIAEPMREYMPFKAWMHVGDLVEGMKWVQENREKLPRLNQQAQVYVRTLFGPEDIGRQWESLFGSISGRGTNTYPDL